MIPEQISHLKYLDLKVAELQRAQSELWKQQDAILQEILNDRDPKTIEEILALKCELLEQIGTRSPAVFEFHLDLSKKVKALGGTLK